MGLGGALARPKPPVLVELYTSQGCSACMAANALPAELQGRKGVLALTLPVDYWDYLGWRDTLAQPAFTQRQRAYAKALGVREVYTPQVVVEGVAQTGRPQIGASLSSGIDSLIAKAAKSALPGPRLRLGVGKVSIGAGHAPRGGAEVWLVRYQPMPDEVMVKDGENRGKTVQYRNVVRQLVKLGGWTGKAKSYSAPAAEDGDLKTAVLLQAKGGGRILAVLTP
jgi:hypothetical protein